MTGRPRARTQIYTKKKVKHPPCFFEMTNVTTSITRLLTR